MGQLRANVEDLLEHGLVGDWVFEPDDSAIWIRIPDGTPDGEASKWRIEPVNIPGQDDWQWDGNRAAPTLTPSLNAVGIWHGYMRAGVLVNA